MTLRNLVFLKGNKLKLKRKTKKLNLPESVIGVIFFKKKQVQVNFIRKSLKVWKLLPWIVNLLRAERRKFWLEFQL